MFPMASTNRRIISAFCKLIFHVRGILCAIGDMHRAMSSFMRFLLGFTLFISVSIGITYAVTRIEIAQQKEEQTAAAYQVLLGNEDLQAPWWQFWHRFD